jgi:hypothetical protein
MLEKLCKQIWPYDARHPIEKELEWRRKIGDAWPWNLEQDIDWCWLFLEGVN